MAYEDDRGQPGSPDQPQPGQSVPALERRVARLEQELEALRTQVAASFSASPLAVPGGPPAPAIAPPFSVREPHVIPQPTVAVEPLAGAGGAAGDAFTPPLPRSPEPLSYSSAQSVHKRDSFENRLGSQIFNRIGIVLLLIGTAWFLKLAVDRRWIVPSPTGRVLAGLLAGAAIVLWSERFRRKGFAAFSYSLKALGSGVLYLSLWAAFQLYHLMPASVALGLMVLVTAWNAYMAWAQNSELLATYALAGGFATPMLVSSGGNHETFLFTYLLAIDLATVILVRLKHWPRLLLGAFPLTMAYFIGWYAQWFDASALGLTSVFIVLFDSTFSSVAIQRPARADGSGAGVRPESHRAGLIRDILLPLANAAFLSLAFYSVLQDSGHHALLPWLMVVLAAVYLGFMRLPQTRTASAIHLSIAIVFLTIAVPLKASGHWITASWLVEGVALLWVATRLAPAALISEPSEAYASRTLRWLGGGALLLGLAGVMVHVLFHLYPVTAFWGADTATALTGVAAFAAAAWLALRSARSTIDSSGWRTIASGCFVAINIIALALAVHEVFFSWSEAERHAPFASGSFFTALLSLAIFAGVIAASLRLRRIHPGLEFWIRWAAVSIVAFNLEAIFTGVREIEAVWVTSGSGLAAGVDNALQQSLAISAFLMLYGAVLLAAGFWKRSAFLRWQALLLLVFTIFKAFLYDMRNLSQGYRVVSFLGLGALLMAISFAYQKDWLNLRAPDQQPAAVPPPEPAP